LVEEAKSLLIPGGPSEFTLDLETGGEAGPLPEQGGELDDSMGGGSDEGEAGGPKEISPDVCEPWNPVSNVT
jgi:hypothetical protein